MSELILSSYTYDQGRVAINDSFSATATFNDVVSNGVLTAATYYSGNTNLGQIIYSAQNAYFSSGTGSASIIASNGTGNNAGGAGAISLGNATTATGSVAFAIGNQSTAQGNQSFAGGLLSTAGGLRSFAFGQSSTASGTNSSAFGLSGSATSSASFVIGSLNTASSNNAFAGGSSSFSTGENAFAFGISVSAQSASAFASGQFTRANATAAFTSGIYTKASGSGSFAGGQGNSSTQLVEANGASSFNHSTVDGSYAGNGIDSNSTRAVILGGLNHEIKLNAGVSSVKSAIIGGEYGMIEGGPSAGLFVGSNNRITSNLTGGIYSAIIGGQQNQVYDLEGAVILGSSGLTASSETYKVYMQKAYIDGYIDLNPQTVMPSPQAGRMFYSGAPLNRMIVFTGATASDYMVLN